MNIVHPLFLLRYQRIWLFIVICNINFLAITFSSATDAQQLTATPEKEIIVGTYECPPFIMLDHDGNYSGLSFLLWQQIANTLDIRYTIKNYPLKELLHAVEYKDVDVGISCLSITPERERIFDFSHSFYETHLAIAVKSKGYYDTIKSILFNKHLLKVITIFFIAAALVGGIFYILEHRINNKLYSMQSASAKLIEGFILGLLFITKGPFNYFEFKTLSGRVLTVCLAVFTTLFIASITAVLASTFTIGLISNDIKTPHDLINFRTGAKIASTSSQYLIRHSIAHRQYKTVSEMLDALERGDIEAIVDDDAVLKYQIKIAKEQGRYQNINVLPYQFEKQNYGFALIENSPYEESINRELLQFRKSEQWRHALLDYFSLK